MCTDLELGKLWYLLVKLRNMSEPDHHQFKSTRRRKDLIHTVPDLVQERTTKWNKYIIDNNDLVSD